MKKLLMAAVLLGILLPSLVTGSWLFTEVMIEQTGDEAFCTGCHSMKPMAAAYRASLHGGNNSHGVQAICVDCHLPHDNPAVYLYQKGITGLRDIWAEYTSDVSAIDWEAKRAHREEFVYDSGCLHCHKNLQNATEANNKAFVAHKPYFLGTVETRCVSCHQHVGHKDLSQYLQSASN